MPKKKPVKKTELKATRFVEAAKESAAKEVSEAELARLRGENAKLRRKCKVAADEAAELKQANDVLLGLGELVPRICEFTLPKGRTKRPAAAAIAVASDWHVDERVYPERVGGKNSFDLTEAETRIGRFFDGVLINLDESGEAVVIDELWMPLLGDLMSGTIHEELLETNTVTPVQAVAFLQDMLCSGIDLLLKKTKLPLYIPTVCGNHSRTTEKKRAKTAVQNSYEWLLYITLAKYYAKQRRVMFSIGEGQFNTVNIKGRRVRLHHGDSFIYRGGIGGIAVPANRAVDALDRIEQADYDFFGHWHSFLLHYPKWVSCGCLVGYNEYAMGKQLPFQHPTQTFALMEREYGLRKAEPIFLTDPASVR
jgi:hypothetical protein